MSDENKNYITGYYGCNCHPFSSWKECRKFHNQKLKIGEKVKNRHTGKIGNVCAIHKTDPKGFVIVKYGKHPCDQHLNHVAELEVIK